MSYFSPFHKLNCHNFIISLLSESKLLWQSNICDTDVATPASFFVIISGILQICIWSNPAHCRGGTLLTACKCSFPSARSHWSVLDHVAGPALSLVEPSLPAWLRGSTSLLTVSHPLLVRMPYVLLLSWHDRHHHCHPPSSSSMSRWIFCVKFWSVV